MSFKFIPSILIIALFSSCSSFGQWSLKKKAIVSVSAPQEIATNAFDDTAEESDTPFGPKAMRLASNVNTAYADFAPFRYGDRLYFSSPVVSDKSGQLLHQIFSSIESGSVSVWPENSKEPGIHTSHIVFSANGQKVYFTLCQDKPTGGQNCEIYTRERAFEGYWLPQKRLPNAINLAGYTATQPTIGFNRALRKEVIYFASDRPGGKGGMDIWCSTIERNGTFAKPFPLPFNTAADEVTPFFHQPNQVLYFSSNGPDGATGFDIFRAANTWTGAGDSHWSAPEKLEKPFNSNYDDLYFSWHTGSGKAYFSSNRSGAADYDIFQTDIQTELIAQVFDALDSTMIMGYKLQLHQLSDIASAALPGLSDGIETKFFVETEKKYRLTTTAIGYQPDTLEVVASQVDGFTALRQPIYLKPRARLLVRAYNAIDSLPLGGVSMQLGIEGSGDKRFVKNKEEETEHSFLIGAGDVMSLVVMKPGFATTYVKPNAHSRIAPTSDPHLNVYLSPFTEAPLALYFDNDEPRWVRPMDMETNFTYEQTLKNYLARKQVFVEKSVEGLPTEEAEYARTRLQSFFDNEVEANYARLDRLCAQLETYLKKGYKLEVLAVGEASPLASPDYNRRLISRRISSVENQLKVWQNGTLAPYFANGNLVISSEMKVMENEGEKVMVKLNDRRQTEFSPEASTMRKVVIEGVRRQKPKA